MAREVSLRGHLEPCLLEFISQARGISARGLETHREQAAWIPPPLLPPAGTRPEGRRLEREGQTHKEVPRERLCSHSVSPQQFPVVHPGLFHTKCLVARSRMATAG